jgi:hypothetical protein
MLRATSLVLDHLVMALPGLGLGLGLAWLLASSL